MGQQELPPLSTPSTSDDDNFPGSVSVARLGHCVTKFSLVNREGLILGDVDLKGCLMRKHALHLQLWPGKNSCMQTFALC